MPDPDTDDYRVLVARDKDGRYELWRYKDGTGYAAMLVPMGLTAYADSPDKAADRLSKMLAIYTKMVNARAMEADHDR